VVMHSKPLKPGPGVWGNGFLPAVYQGSPIAGGPTPIANLTPPASMRNGDQRATLDYLQGLNRAHASDRHDSELDARITSYELAYRMQSAAPEAVDLSRESSQTRTLYGGNFGEQCLIARRLVERGVRFVQLWHGAGQPWDSHDDIQDHRRLATECDQAIGALLVDLKQRGLLDETLVIWGGEFGRTPTVELPAVVVNTGLTKGRDHNHYGFSMWLAGGGVKGGYVHGATDEFGFKAVENKVHVHDLHATILHLLGFDHEKFTYRYAGRDFRLTDVSGRVVREILA